MTKLKVLAVGNGAGNILKGIKKSDDVEFWAINTDKQVLNSVGATNKLQIGKNITNGLCAGGNPIIGERAIKETADDISAIIQDTEVIITVACLGGGTGSGAAPAILKKISEETNAKSLAVVTMPFGFEGNRKNQQAIEALEEIKKYTDKVIVFENNTIIPTLDKKITFSEAFLVVDKIISDLILKELKNE